MFATEDEQLLERLSKYQIFADFQSVVGEATGLPLTVRPIHVGAPSLHDHPRENPLCARLEKSRKPCAACLAILEPLAKNPGPLQPTAGYLAGFSETSIPLRFGHQLVGFLQSGQGFMENGSTDDRFAKAARRALDWGLRTGLTRMEKAWFHTRVQIEKAKSLPLNPNVRINEVAFAVGFQSFTHFNRVFRKVLGESPTEYRRRLPRGGTR